ncbi:hypothetical protein [Streptosporangium sp. NPDC000396]
MPYIEMCRAVRDILASWAGREDEPSAGIIDPQSVKIDGNEDANML